MATAGGAKMEPASCAKQSSSRNALRCLRSVPPWERHSAERGGEAGWGSGAVKGNVITSARRSVSHIPDVPRVSLVFSDWVVEVTAYFLARKAY